MFTLVLKLVRLGSDHVVLQATRLRELLLDACGNQAPILELDAIAMSIVGNTP